VSNAGTGAYLGIIGVRVATAWTETEAVTVAKLATFGTVNDAYIINPEEADLSTNRLTLSSAASKIFYGLPDGTVTATGKTVFILITDRGAVCT
jgi:hypothetical protein